MRPPERQDWPNQDTPFILPSVGVMHPSWGWSWLRVGGTEKPFVKMNIPVASRNATTPGRGPMAMRGAARGPRVSVFARFPHDV